MTAFILISSDLMFIGKVREVSIASGRDLQTIRSLESLAKVVKEGTVPSTLMLDLERTPISLEALSEPIRDMIVRGWRVVSFYSHVHEELSARAAALGLGEVMPRSRFVRELQSLFAGRLDSSGSTN
jgi:hypothetical protein